MSKIDQDKISDFKNNEVPSENYSSFCMKTKPNNRYFTKLIKNEVEGFMNVYGDQIKKEEPAKFFSIMNKKLPKKYQVEPFPTAPVNAHIPPQSKLTPEELKAEMEREKQVKEEKNKKYWDEKCQQHLKEKQASERMRMIEKHKQYIYWTNPFPSINQNRLGSSKVMQKEKNYEYY